MAINSKSKGKRGELEICQELKKYGYDCRRTVQYNGKADEGEADILGLKGLRIEVKRVEKLNIYNAIDQAKRDAKNDDMPTVFHRKNRCNWLVTMELDEFMKLYDGYIKNEKIKAYVDKNTEGNNG